MLYPVRHRFGLVLVFTLMLSQAQGAYIFEAADEARTANAPKDAVSDFIPGHGQNATIVQPRDFGLTPIRFPPSPASPGRPFLRPFPEDMYRSYPDFERFGAAIPNEPLLTTISLGPEMSMNFPGLQIKHRGELALEPSVFGRDISPFSYGPDTPPPSSGDWIVDEAGNNVNNTTIVLDGNLKVTTGDLTLDNVSLVMNCTVDGQYGINVSAGGTLNVINTNISAFNGSLHYKFAVYGCMTMELCDVSEMWGDYNVWWDGGGVSLFSSGAVIRSSMISRGESSGIEVHGSIGPEIIGTTVARNGRHGLMTLDTAHPAIKNCSSTGNGGSGIGVGMFSTPVVTNCAFTNNSRNGIQVSESAQPEITTCSAFGNDWNGLRIVYRSTPKLMNCTFTNNSMYGILVEEFTQPEITNCTSMDNNWSGILVRDTCSPVVMNCTFIGNKQGGILVVLESTPVITNCIANNNLINGIYVGNTSQPTITDCIVKNNSQIGIQVMVSARPTIKNCTSTGNIEIGIYLGGTSIPMLINCSATDNSKNGIQIMDSANPTIKNCISTCNDWGGVIVCGNSTPAFFNCTFANNSNNGISVMESANPTITDCTSTANNWSGICISGTPTPVFTNCSTASNSGHGMQIGGFGHATITNCNSIKNTNCGIFVLESAIPALTNCKSIGNNQTGIATLSTSIPVLTNCSAVDNIEYGMDLEGSGQPILTDCTSTGNDWCGFRVGDTSTAVLTDCNATNNSLNGIDVTESSQPTILNCTSTGNTGNGIAIIETSAPVLTNCSTINNSNYGCVIGYSAHPIITNCVSISNNWSGIYATATSTPLLTNCSTINNSNYGFAIDKSAHPIIINCKTMGNRVSGIIAADTSAPFIKDCICSKNNQKGLEVLDSCFPRLDGLQLSENPAQNLQVTSTAPIVLANSTLSGGSTHDIMLANNSRLTLLNTTCTKQPLLTGTAQLKVQWYLSFRVYDHANRLIKGAMVDGAGKNGSRASTVTSGPDGIARDLIATEYIQNASTSEQEFTYYGPYDLTVTKDGDRNTTYDIPVQRSISWRLYLDAIPRIGSLPEMAIIEDRPVLLDLVPYISDADDPISNLFFTTDRDYATVGNDTKIMTITCPYNIDSDVVTVTVSDGLKNSTQSLNLRIVTVNDRPYCRNPIADLDALEDQTLTIGLADFLWDEESGSRLTFTCNYDEISVDNELRQATWTPGEGNSSLEAVTFSAWDGYLEGMSNEFNITFIAVNDPPLYLGGLKDASVYEHKNWTLNLDTYFWDEEDTKGLKFESSNPEVIINNIRHIAYWTPSGNASYSMDVLFNAQDASNSSLVVESDTIVLTYVPVNDPPIYQGTLKNARLRLGEEWNITLEDFFKDEDTESVRFSSNNPNVKITERSKTKHCAVWKPDRYSSDVIGLVFTAYDGKTYTRSDPITLSFEAPVNVEQPTPVTNIIQRIPLYVYILMPLFLIAGVAAFYTYRRVKYGKYDIEQIFLIYKDGRLLAHRSRKKIASGGEEVISGMLTALQGFIKESLQDDKRGELDEMKYGDLKIAIERGEKVYLAVFLSGYVTESLRALMVDALQKVDNKYGTILESWDGTVSKLKGVEAQLDALMGGTVAPVEAVPAAKGVAPAPATTKKLLQRVIAFMPSAGPGEEVILKGELEFYQGFVRLKVAAKNSLDMTITDCSFKLVYDSSLLRLDHIEPSYTLKGDEVSMGIIEPSVKKTVAFYMDPQLCSESFLEGVLSYKDVRGYLQTVTLARKLASVVCPIFFTDENINTAMLKRMVEEELDRKDSKVFKLPDGIDPKKTFELGKAAVKYHDVRLVREFVEETPFVGEAWYYGKVKGREDKLVIKVRVMGVHNILELYVASGSKLMLTGLLAELKTDLARELKIEGVPVEKVKVVDPEAVGGLLAETTLLDTTSEDGGK